MFLLSKSRGNSFAICILNCMTSAEAIPVVPLNYNKKEGFLISYGIWQILINAPSWSRWDSDSKHLEAGVCTWLTFDTQLRYRDDSNRLAVIKMAFYYALLLSMDFNNAGQLVDPTTLPIILNTLFCSAKNIFSESNQKKIKYGNILKLSNAWLLLFIS